MKLASRTLLATCAALVLSAVSASADAHGRRGYWGPGPFWGGIGVGLGVGVGIGLSSGYYYRPWYPGYVVVDAPPPVYYRSEPQPVPAAPAPDPVARPAPDPIFYPKSGQSDAQTEADRVDCNRWATTQPSAMRDASVFQRATLACMEGRGYVVK